MQRTLSVLLMLGALCLVVFMITSANRAEISPLAAGLLSFLGILAVGFGCLFLEVTTMSGPPSIETHWGGLGGDLGGWRISESLAYLVASITFAAMFTVAAINTLPKSAAKLAAAQKPAVNASPVSRANSTAAPAVAPTQVSSPVKSPTAGVSGRASSVGVFATPDTGIK